MVTIFFLILFVNVHFSGAFRLGGTEVNSDVENSNGISAQSPFGTTVQLSKFTSLYAVQPENAKSSTFEQSLSPPLPSLPPLCPETMFTCTTVAKNNDLFRTSTSKSRKFICIDQNRLCDRQVDCPNGEDEDEIRCPTKVVAETPVEEGKIFVKILT